MLTIETFARMAQCSLITASQWQPWINEAMERWRINTPRKQAGFVAQMSHECGRFTVFEENLNYSAEGLARVWPGRYSVDPKAVVKVPNELARRLHRNPELIANYTYASRMGNGDVASGDGWRYRGRGPKQITGFDNYSACGRALGLPLVSEPDMLMDPRYGAHAAGWYWYMRGCNEVMEANDYREVTKRINGGFIGHDKRVLALENCYSVLGIA